jgi:hypothetical protein
VTYPVRGLHYGPALAVTLWTQAGSIPGNQARAGSVVLGSFINIVTGWARVAHWHGSVAGIVTLHRGLPRDPQHHRDAGSQAGFTLPDSDAVLDMA